MVYYKLLSVAHVLIGSPSYRVSLYHAANALSVQSFLDNKVAPKK